MENRKLYELYTIKAIICLKANDLAILSLLISLETECESKYKSKTQHMLPKKDAL